MDVFMILQPVPYDIAGTIVVNQEGKRDRKKENGTGPILIK
jgi:hypothetical protein